MTLKSSSLPSTKETPPVDPNPRTLRQLLEDSGRWQELVELWASPIWGALRGLMSASRLSQLEALGRALSSNDVAKAQQFNAVAQFIQETFLDPVSNIETELRSLRAELEAERAGNGTGHTTNYMKDDGLPEADADLEENLYDA